MYPDALRNTVIECRSHSCVGTATLVQPKSFVAKGNLLPSSGWNRIGTIAYWLYCIDGPSIVIATS